MTFYTSNYPSHFTEYEHNKELTQRERIEAITWNFSQNYFLIKKKSTESTIYLQIVVQIYLSVSM